MKKRSVRGVDVEIGSGNVFADLDLPNADKLKIKSGLAIEITKAVRKLGLTQQQAAQRMNLTQPKVSALLRGEFSNLSERKLMDCLNRLGYDIEIRVKPASESVGHMRLDIARSRRKTGERWASFPIARTQNQYRTANKK
jgi:predicted XRE-type DNA-binding protein